MMEKKKEEKYQGMRQKKVFYASNCFVPVQVYVKILLMIALLLFVHPSNLELKKKNSTLISTALTIKTSL